MKFTLWKPYGITSNYFIDTLKHTYKYSKICYAGRLDPLAQGMMLILTDEDVKLMSINLKHNKTYKFDIILGLATSSSDIAGNIINDENISSDYDEVFLKNKLIEFIKIYDYQDYPNVSSFVIKHEIFGRKPLWWFAKNNITVNIPNKTIEILDYKIYNITKITEHDFYNDALERLKTITNNKTIDELYIDDYINIYKNKIECLNSNFKETYKVKVSMELTVSSGFYIRQFCNDFGKYINISAIAFDITRINFC
jgi:tRNA pseudouridine(55) synthase